MSIQVPADAKNIKWSAIIADRGENKVTAYTLENQSTETTPGSTVEMVFNRPCGPGDPVPVAPTCKIVTQSPIYAGDNVVVNGDGVPTPTWKAAGGTPSTGPAGASFQTKFDGPGDYVIISENSEGEAKCPLTVLPKKIVIDPTVFICSASLPKAQVGQAITFSAAGNKTAGTKAWTTDKDGSPNTWSGDKFTTAYSTPGTHKSTAKVGDEVAECTIIVEPPTESCSMTKANLDGSTSIINQTHATATFVASVTGATGATGVLTVDNNVVSSGAPLAFERYGPGVEHNTTATYTTSLNGQVCGVIKKTLPIPPQDYSPESPCYMVVRHTLLAPSLVRVQAVNVGIEKCYGSGVRGKLELNADFTSFDVKIVKVQGEYVPLDKGMSWHNLIQFSLGELERNQDAIADVSFQSNATSAKAGATDIRSDFQYWYETDTFSTR